MVMNIAHQPTEAWPDAYSGNSVPRPTGLVGFSGISAVPVHSQARIATIARTPLAPAATYWWNTGKMKAPPVNTAAPSVRNVGPGTRRHCAGTASTVEVISVSRLPSSSTGKNGKGLEEEKRG